jgi:hypothetical protein
VGLNEKLKVREAIEEELVITRKTVEISEVARSELHGHLEDSSRKTLEEAEKNKKYQDIIIH